MDGHGLPLLSGPPPPNTSGTAEMGCRKCAKEFNILFTRSRRCNHCGYAYCNSCSDFQALMPRDSSSGQSGYDPMNVCAYCIEFLQITASGKGALKSLPLAKLRKYAGAYNIRIDHAVEKDDVIDALLAARLPNGCLSPQNESYYRKYSVPNRSGPGPSSTRARVQNLFSGSSSRNFNSSNSVPHPPHPPPPPQHSRPEFARPDLEPDGREDRGIPIRPRMQPYSTPSGAPPPLNTASRPQPTPAASAPRPVPTPTPGSGPHSNYAPSRPGSVPPRPRASSAAPSTRTPPPPPQPTPTLEELIAMTTESLSSLSISTLKAILYTNHVSSGMGSGMILEKGDLVRRVIVLVEDEKRERREHEERELEEQTLRQERERMEREKEEKEDQERIRIQHAMMEAFERERKEREERDREQQEERTGELENDRLRVDGESESQSQSDVDRDSTPSSSPPPPIPPKAPTPFKAPSKAPATAAFVERTGLCVVCQDEEANIAVVDCGHLAMCRTCCDAIMQSTRECPLCRTRIVTEARLLRIFKA
ncbi:hypothetical protein DFH05DRAFT_1396808 [Lentinula detonsa]|uniref:RING-type domain-containing protein n=1 Tax=Lentinula detonsa TaxID=2804962 RepID=A0A9W8P1S9_9AGAR|nr:hypothetical protein DFH05DRAFT_1396808 [Lentinula detonsa]